MDISLEQIQSIIRESIMHKDEEGVMNQARAVLILPLIISEREIEECAVHWEKQVILAGNKALWSTERISFPYYWIQKMFSSQVFMDAALERLEFCLLKPGFSHLEKIISLNDCDAELEYLLLEKIKAGQKVSIYVQPPSAVNALWDRYMQLLDAVQEIGFSIIYSQNNPQALISELLMVEDVELAIARKQLCIEMRKGCIVTPLARDKAREQKIRLKWV